MRVRLNLFRSVPAFSPDRAQGSFRALGAAGGLVVAVALLLATASPAFAGRNYDSQIGGFNLPDSVAFDANGNAWITDVGHEIATHPGTTGIYEYDPYPSQTLLDVPDTENIEGYLRLQAAIDYANGEVFVGQSNGRTVYIYDEAGEYSHSWTSINGSNGGAAAQAGIFIAIDNTNTYSRGRVYLSLVSPENDVEVVDSAQMPVDFPPPPATSPTTNLPVPRAAPSAKCGISQSTPSATSLSPTEAKAWSTSLTRPGPFCARFPPTEISPWTRPMATSLSVAMNMIPRATSSKDFQPVAL